MQKVSVVLIDDNNDYRWVLEHFITRHGFLVTGSFTHKEFVGQTELDVVPDIAIISFDKLLTEQTISFVRKNYRPIKILINSLYEDRKSINAIIEMAVEGLIFKISKATEQHIMEAIEALKQDRKYFVEIK